MPSQLKDFYLNEVMRNDVHAYLVEFLKAVAIEKAFNREDIAGVAEAKECLDKAFENLDVIFASKSEAKDVSNQAR